MGACRRHYPKINLRNWKARKFCWKGNDTKASCIKKENNSKLACMIGISIPGWVGTTFEIIIGGLLIWAAVRVVLKILPVAALAV